MQASGPPADGAVEFQGGEGRQGPTKPEARPVCDLLRGEGLAPEGLDDRSFIRGRGPGSWAGRRSSRTGLVGGAGAEGLAVAEDVLQHHRGRLHGRCALTEEAGDAPGHGVVHAPRHREDVLPLIRGPARGDE